MNGFERVMAAMRLEVPDRVPIVEFVVDPKVCRAICPEARDFGELAEFLDLDSVGCGAVFDHIRETGDGWVDEWSVRYVRSPQVVSHPVEGPIRSMDDLASYQPPDPDAPHRLGLLRQYVERYKGSRAIIFHHRAAFMWAAYLMGLENLLIAFAADPPLVDAVMDIVVNVNEQIVRRAVRAGADIVVLADDYASNQGPMFSRHHFERFVLPRFQRVVDAIQEEGALVIKHSDGNLWPLLDLIVDTGVDAINPLEPVADMDLAQVKLRFGDRVCLVGNVDCGELLSHGTTRQVEEAVRRCLVAAAENGAYMLSSSNSIHASVNPANYVAMVRAGHRWGKYPIGF
jgi:uroporphyrinogen decarboxylase